jgi:predicted transcriptional regulator
MATDSRHLFISVRPQYTVLLLSGTKTVEVRRGAPNVQPGATVLIYASANVRALVGVAEIAEIIVGSRRSVWEEHGPATGLSRAAFDRYLFGAAQAVGIRLSGVAPLSRPIPLPELRIGRPWFTPPQSFRYLSPYQLDSLLTRPARKSGRPPHLAAQLQLEPA